MPVFRAEAAAAAFPPPVRRLLYLAFAERAASALAGPRRGAWRACVAAERDNVRAALAWRRARGVVTDGGTVAGARRLAEALGL